MYVRLAFAVAIHVDPEILLVDESLSVGDVYFQQRCMRKIRQMKQEGKTILFVSHDMTAVKNLCDAAVWLEHGEVKGIGEPEEVVGKYLATMTMRRDPYATETAEAVLQWLETGTVSVGTLPNANHRWGNRRGGHGIQILDARGIRCEWRNMARQSWCGSRWHFTRRFPAGVGIFMRNHLGEDICGLILRQSVELRPPGAASALVDFNVKLPLLVPGDYTLRPRLLTERTKLRDLRSGKNAIHLVVRKRRLFMGI
jgi:hypothetical protein